MFYNFIMLCFINHKKHVFRSSLEIMKKCVFLEHQKWSKMERAKLCRIPLYYYYIWHIPLTPQNKAEWLVKISWSFLHFFDTFSLWGHFFTFLALARILIIFWSFLDIKKWCFLKLLQAFCLGTCFLMFFDMFFDVFWCL